MYGVLKVKQNARGGSGIWLVHKHCAATQEIAVSLQCEVDGGIEEGVSRTHKSGQRLLLERGNQRFLEGDALISRQYRLANANHGDHGYELCPGTCVTS